MGKTIGQLTQATTINNADELVVEQSGVTKRVAASVVRGALTNANVDAAAAIAGTKISPNFGSQNVVTTGTTTAASFRITGTKTTALINYLGTQSIVTPDADDWRTSIRVASASDTSPNTISLWANNQERFRITASGNIGIGTASPAASYQIDTQTTANSFWGARLYNTSSGSSASSALQLGNDQNGAAAAIILASSTNTGIMGGANTLAVINGLNAPVAFGTNSAERMRITAGGAVAIGTTSPDAAALLDVSSTTQGLLPPRMTTAQRDAISTPPAGLILYNTTTNKLQVRTNSAWADLH